MKNNNSVFVVTSDKEELIDFSGNIVIPEYYYKHRLINKYKDLKYVDYSFNYKYSIEEKGYIAELSNRVLDAIAKRMNEVFAIEFGRKQWGYLYKYIIVNCEYWLYEKYKKIEFIIRDYEDIYTVSHHFKKNCSSNILYSDSSKLFYDDDYNEFVYSQLIEAFGKKVEWIENIGDNGLNVCKKEISIYGKLKKYSPYKLLFNGTSRRNFFKNIRNRSHYKPYGKKISPKAEVLLIRTFMPYAQMKDIEKESDGKITDKDIDYYLHLEGKIVCKNKGYDNIRGNFLKYFKAKNHYEELLVCFLPDFIPRISLEYFKECHDIAYELINNWPNLKKIYTAAGIGAFDSSSIVNIIAAAYSNKGTRIIDVQHAAGYGADRRLSENELLIFDEFVTWGWIDETNPQIRACRNIRYEKQVKKKNKKINADRPILYVTDGSPKFNGCLIHGENFVERHFALLKFLPQHIRKKMTVRLRNDVFGMDEIYRCEFPEIEIEWIYDCDFVVSASKRELVIVDVNCSPYYECLMMGIPTILYEAFVFDSYIPQMVEYYNLMRKEGLYYDDAEKCGLAVSCLFNNGFKWWDKKKERLVEKILISFFNEETDYTKMWENEFLCK